MNDNDISPSAVTTLDSEGKPVSLLPRGRARQRRGIVTAAVVAFVVLVGVGGVLAWRALVGSPYSAAEAVPADADIVITIDFLQLRDLDRVDRFIQAFADPMAQHGFIDAAPDLESAMREFDDVAEEELGFRFAEDVLSWIGRSGAIALWVPDAVLDPVAIAEPNITLPVLATLDVRDVDGAQAFLDRMLGEARTAGAAVTPTTVGGVEAHEVAGTDAVTSLVVALDGEQFLIADSLASMERAIQLDTNDSVAQTDDFQELAAALGDDHLVTFYVSGALGERMGDAFADLGFGIPAPEGDLFPASLSGAVLDDNGLSMRTATFVPATEPETAPGSWAGQLPTNAYGFLNLTVPERFLSDVADAMLSVLADTGAAENVMSDVVEPADQLLGVSLLDELLPQFGREVLLAVLPTEAGAPVSPAVLFAIGVADPDPLQTALANVSAALSDEGVPIRTEGTVTTFELDPTLSLAVSVAADAFYVSLTTPVLEDFVENGSGGLVESEAFDRVDRATIGDGLILYADIAAVVTDYVEDEAARDILAPLTAIGVGAERSGDVEVSEMRVMVDY